MYFLRVVRRLLARRGKSAAQRPVETLRIFMVRTGAYEFGENGKEVTDVGREQMRHAATVIRERAGSGALTVCADLGAARHRIQSATVLAKALGVNQVLVDFVSVPDVVDIHLLVSRFGRVLVTVVDGTNLAAALRKHPGPPVQLYDYQVQHGSVHEMVITYHPSTPLDGLKVVSYEFV